MKLFLGALSLFWAMAFSLTLHAEQLLEVLDNNGDPVPNAQILIGLAKDNPFKGNVISTNNKGLVPVPAAWTAPLPVSVVANGYVTTTFENILPAQQQFTVDFADQPQFFELKGNANGFGNLKKDGMVDVGFVMPTFDRRGLLSFDVSSVLSPENDTIKIIGRDVDIPSNISLPKQKESYGFFTINLDKPQYRAFSRTAGVNEFLGSHAKFPLKKVVDKIRAGKSMLEVINDFTFIGGGIVSANMGSTPARKDIAINDMIYNTKVNVTGGNVPSNKVMMSLAAIEKDGQLFPTDVKYVQSGETLGLAILNTTDKRYVASILGNKPQKISKTVYDWAREFFDPTLPGFEDDEESENFGQISIALSEIKSLSVGTPEFLPLIDPPQINGDHLQLSPPPISGNIEPVGTIVILSDVEIISRGKFDTEKRTRLREFFVEGWSSKVRIPNLQMAPTANKTRWEVIYLGKQQGSSGSHDLNGTTHITRNSIDL